MEIDRDRDGDVTAAALWSGRSFALLSLCAIQWRRLKRKPGGRPNYLIFENILDLKTSINLCWVFNLYNLSNITRYFEIMDFSSITLDFGVKTALPDFFYWVHVFVGNNGEDREWEEIMEDIYGPVEGEDLR